MTRAYSYNVLIVDDDESFLKTFKYILNGSHRLFLARNCSEAQKVLARERIDVLFLDIILPDANGLTLLKEVKASYPDVEVIMLTAVKEVKKAVAAMQGGAFHYITKDFHPEEIFIILDKVYEKQRCNKELVSLRSEVELLSSKEMLLGRSESCKQIKQLICQVADLPATVLIQGESGTGKELLARAIHRQSQHSSAPFVTVNVASLPKQLVESELFGHEKGSFTGATSHRVGKIELADGGVLFLDEVGEIELDVQVKLLRFLQEGEFSRVGSNRVIRTNIRLIAATNRDLQKLVQEERFREDFYYRLNVIPITLPPLRERTGEIPELTRLFLDRYSKRFGRPSMSMDSAAIKLLQQYRWPGNIRELEHLIERLVATCEKRTIGVTDIPMEYLLAPVNVDKMFVSASSTGQRSYFRQATSLFERNLILKALMKSDGNRKKTALRLGIPLSTLKFKMQKLEMKNVSKSL